MDDNLQSAESTDKGKGQLGGADLGLLYSHRLSHVAETGQLVPRSRRSTSGESAHACAREPKSRSHPPVTYRGISRSAPTTPTVEQRNPFWPLGPGTAPTPNVAVVGPEANLPTGKVTDKNAAQEQTASTNEHSPPGRNPTEQSRTDAVVASVSSREISIPAPTFEHNKGSKILRKVNDGFEILQPGSLTRVKSPIGVGGKAKGDRTRRHSRRLSKERPSTERKRNSFIEVIYGNERHPR